MTDDQIEQKIQAKGLTAPRITPKDIDDAVSEEGILFHVFPGTTTTICYAPLKNGYSVTGVAAAVSVENFDPEIGRVVALKDAKEKLWSLLGYGLREELNRAWAADVD